MRREPAVDDRAKRASAEPRCVVCGGRVVRASYIRGEAYHCLTEDVLVSTEDVVYEDGHE